MYQNKKVTEVSILQLQSEYPRGFGNRFTVHSCMSPAVQELADAAHEIIDQWGDDAVHIAVGEVFAPRRVRQTFDVSTIMAKSSWNLVEVWRGNVAEEALRQSNDKATSEERMRRKQVKLRRAASAKRLYGALARQGRRRKRQGEKKQARKKRSAPKRATTKARKGTAGKKRPRVEDPAADDGDDMDEDVFDAVPTLTGGLKRRRRMRGKQPDNKENEKTSEGSNRPASPPQSPKSDDAKEDERIRDILFPPPSEPSSPSSGAASEQSEPEYLGALRRELEDLLDDHASSKGDDASSGGNSPSENSSICGDDGSPKLSSAADAASKQEDDPGRSEEPSPPARTVSPPASPQSLVGQSQPAPPGLVAKAAPSCAPIPDVSPQPPQRFDVDAPFGGTQTFYVTDKGRVYFGWPH